MLSRRSSASYRNYIPDIEQMHATQTEFIINYNEIAKENEQNKKDKPYINESSNGRQ